MRWAQGPPTSVGAAAGWSLTSRGVGYPEAVPETEREDKDFISEWGVGREGAKRVC